MHTRPAPVPFFNRLIAKVGQGLLFPPIGRDPFAHG